MRHRNSLTLVELKELWTMYQLDAKLALIAFKFKISEEYTLECIEAAKHLYGGGLDELRKDTAAKAKRMRDIPFEHVPMPEQTVGKFIRPKAVYTNQRLYDLP